MKTRRSTSRREEVGVDNERIPPRVVQGPTVFLEEEKEEVSDIPLFHCIFNTFSLSLICVQKPVCIDFLCKFLFI